MRRVRSPKPRRRRNAVSDSERERRDALGPRVGEPPQPAAEPRGAEPHTPPIFPAAGDRDASLPASVSAHQPAPALPSLVAAENEPIPDAPKRSRVGRYHEGDNMVHYAVRDAEGHLLDNDNDPLAVALRKHHPEKETW